MINISNLLPFALLAAAALAQGASTSTGYAVLATDGTANAFDSQASGTAVGRGLGVRAGVAGAPRTPPTAFASSFVSGGGHFGGATVVVHEDGTVNNRAATGTCSAGTSADAPGTTSPTQGAHGIQLVIAAASGTTGNVTIDWQARQNAGASVSGAVDVDGDGTPDWTGTGAAGNRTTLPVTAGANGIVLAISTNGSASVTGTGRAGYGASLSVSFRASSPSPTLTFTWTPSGPQCLGSLSGSEVVGNRGDVRLDFAVAGGAANGIGLLFVGTAAATPVALPSGTCQLLVDPAGAGMSLFLTDASGNAAPSLRTRARTFTVDYQAVTFGFASGLMGSTNALNLVVQ